MEFQLIGKLSTLSENAKRNNIARSQFAFDTKTTNTSKRSDLKISMLANLVVNILMTSVIVTLLTRLSSFQTFTDNSNLILCFLNDIWSKEGSFTGFGPIQRSTTSPAIQSFKGCHTQTGLKAIVVTEFGKRKTLLPILTER